MRAGGRNRGGRAVGRDREWRRRSCDQRQPRSARARQHGRRSRYAGAPLHGSRLHGRRRAGTGQLRQLRAAWRDGRAGIRALHEPADGLLDAAGRLWARKPPL